MRRFAAVLLLLPACGPDSQGQVVDPFGTLESPVTAKHRVTLRPSGGHELCLSAEGTNGVALAACDESEPQLWARWGNEVHGQDDQCLAIEGDEQDGARVVMANCEEAADRAHWVFGHESLQFGKDGGKCLDVVDGNYQPGAQLQIWTCQPGDAAQQWGWLWSLGKMADTPDQPPGSSKPPGAKARKEVTKTEESKEQAQQPAQAPASKTPARGGQQTQGQHPMQAPKAAQSGVFGASPSGTLVAPYFYAWESPGCVKWLKDAKAKAGLQAATMAFGLSGGGCKVAGFDEYAADIKAFQASGGTIVLSFGGQSGTYLQKTCQNPTQLAQALEKVMQSHNAQHLDFDNEGDPLGDVSANKALTTALVQLQRKYPALQISITLPVDFDGLPPNALNFAKMLADAGLFPLVNTMTMDYGKHPPQGKDAGDAALLCAEATAGQMRKLWPHATEDQIYAHLGITPMVGQQDGHADLPFTPTDAGKVAAYAKRKKLGRLAYWAFQRDVAKSGDYNDHSNSQKIDYEFYRAFLGAK